MHGLIRGLLFERWFFRCYSVAGISRPAPDADDPDVARSLVEKRNLLDLICESLAADENDSLILIILRFEQELELREVSPALVRLDRGSLNDTTQRQTEWESVSIRDLHGGQSIPVIRCNHSLCLSRFDL